MALNFDTEFDVVLSSIFHLARNNYFVKYGISGSLRSTSVYEKCAIKNQVHQVEFVIDF